MLAVQRGSAALQHALGGGVPAMLLLQSRSLGGPLSWVDRCVR